MPSPPVEQMSDRSSFAPDPAQSCPWLISFLKPGHAFSHVRQGHFTDLFASKPGFQNTTFGAPDLFATMPAHVQKRACTIMADRHAMQDEMAQLAGSDGGRVRIGVFPVAGTVIMPRAITQVRKRRPSVEIEVTNVLYPDSINQLREAALDIVPVPDVYGSMVVERMFDIDVVVVTHEENPVRHATSLAELADAHWIIHGSKDGPSSMFAGSRAKRDLPMPRAVTNCHSLPTVIALMQETDAFCVLLEQLFDTISKTHGITIVPIGDPLPRFPLTLVIQKTRPLTPAAAELAWLLSRPATNTSRSTFSHCGSNGLRRTSNAGRSKYSRWLFMPA